MKAVLLAAAMDDMTVAELTTMDSQMPSMEVLTVDWKVAMKDSQVVTTAVL